MDNKDRIIHHSGQRQAPERLAEEGEDLLLVLLLNLCHEPVDCIHADRLVISAVQVHVAGRRDLHGEQSYGHFEGEAASVHEVTIEEVHVVRCRLTEGLYHVQQVPILAVDVAHDVQRAEGRHPEIHEARLVRKEQRRLADNCGDVLRCWEHALLHSRHEKQDAVQSDLAISTFHLRLAILPSKGIPIGNPWCQERWCSGGHFLRRACKRERRRLLVALAVRAKN
mmetsp:Transcript_126844/g.370866  ORF Transcript_126844/g.370866 Transcript_126844/m.370866 type:complete len:225 (+) Transcript_126844:672-1346(+)